MGPLKSRTMETVTFLTLFADCLSGILSVFLTILRHLLTIWRLAGVEGKAYAAFYCSLLNFLASLHYPSKTR